MSETTTEIQEPSPLPVEIPPPATSATILTLGTAVVAGGLRASKLGMLKTILVGTKNIVEEPIGKAIKRRLEADKREHHDFPQLPLDDEVTDMSYINPKPEGLRPPESLPEPPRSRRDKWTREGSVRETISDYDREISNIDRRREELNKDMVAFEEHKQREILAEAAEHQLIDTLDQNGAWRTLDTPVTFTAQHETKMKTSPEGAELLSGRDIVVVPTGFQLTIDAVYFEEPHIRVRPLNKLIKPCWLYAPHWNSRAVLAGEDIDSNEDERTENEEPVIFTPESIDWNDFRCSVSKYFTVGEVVHYSVERIPSNPQTIANILELAKFLDTIREEWGAPIGVTSWHRPLHVNRRVGSGDRSQHILGKAADIYPHNLKFVEFENWLDKRWDMALGYGSRSGRRFTHVDTRTSPARIRWNY